MSIELLERPAPAKDPLESLEAVAAAMELENERVGDGELHMAVPGAWRDAGLWFTWRPELSTMQIGAPLELKAPGNMVMDASRLCAMINERLWVGHFDIWTDDHSVVYRNSVVLPEDGAMTSSQAQILIGGVREAIDRFYPAFNFLIWGGKKPEEALEASLFETAGNA